MYAIKEALVAKEHDPEVDITDLVESEIVTVQNLVDGSLISANVESEERINLCLCSISINPFYYPTTVVTFTITILNITISTCRTIIGFFDLGERIMDEWTINKPPIWIVITLFYFYFIHFTPPYPLPFG